MFFSLCHIFVCYPKHICMCLTLILMGMWCSMKWNVLLSNDLRESPDLWSACWSKGGKLGAQGAESSRKQCWTKLARPEGAQREAPWGWRQPVAAKSPPVQSWRTKMFTTNLTWFQQKQTGCRSKASCAASWSVGICGKEWTISFSDEWPSCTQAAGH